MRIAPRRRRAALQARCTAGPAADALDGAAGKLFDRSDCTNAALMLHWDAWNAQFQLASAARFCLVCLSTLASVLPGIFIGRGRSIDLIGRVLFN